MSEYITSVEELESHYPAPSEKALNKQTDRLDATCREFIAASPFFVLATFGGAGADCSPRGEEPGVLEVSGDGKTLLIPDRVGNNRLDSLHNIVENPAVGLLFVVPGITYTLRINGRARLSTKPELLERFAVRGTVPGCVIEVEVVEAYSQCAKAIHRSDLWNPEKHAAKGDLPTMGEMLSAHTSGAVDGKMYDAFDREAIKNYLY